MTTTGEVSEKEMLALAGNANLISKELDQYFLDAYRPISPVDLMHVRGHLEQFLKSIVTVQTALAIRSEVRRTAFGSEYVLLSDYTKRVAIRQGWRVENYNPRPDGTIIKTPQSWMLLPPGKDAEWWATNHQPGYVNEDEAWSHYQWDTPQNEGGL